MSWFMDGVFWDVFIAFRLKFDGLEYLKVFRFEFAINFNSNINGRHDHKMIGKKSFKDFRILYIPLFFFVKAECWQTGLHAEGLHFNDFDGFDRSFNHLFYV